MSVRALVVLCIASIAQAQSAPCDRPGVLGPRGIGLIAIGMTSDSLARVCRVVGQRKVAEYDLSVIDVRIGSDTVRAFARQGRIEWLEITSPRFRTSDSIGVGSSAAAILDFPDVTGGPGDGTDTYAVWSKSGAHCGLTFWLDGRTAAMLNAARGDRLRLLGMRGGTVAQIDVRGECRER